MRLERFCACFLRCTHFTEDMAKTVACALVRSRLDYANSVLFGVSSHNVTRLQRAQNAAARVVLCGSRRRSTNSLCLLVTLVVDLVASRLRSPASLTELYAPMNLLTYTTS